MNDLNQIIKKLDSVIKITSDYYKANRSPFNVHMAYQKLCEARLWLATYENEKENKNEFPC